ncbi:MAG: 50S ribosomal protein L10 [Actinobacteria bacterium]|nr:50S ribosomal protein L10 [Actinomycetota bacterium]
MLKTGKEKVIAELAERLRASDTLLVADYRGLTMSEIDGLRGELIKHGARFSVVKNTLTRRAAEEAGVPALLALLEGPTAIAFIETGGDLVAVAKALDATARGTNVLTVRGGVLDGSAIGAEDVKSLATLPPTDVIRAQLLGAIAGPLTAVVGLLAAPLRDLVGLIDARIEESAGADSSSEPLAQAEVAAVEPAAEETEPTEDANEGQEES